jgi:putative glutamine amidotransferase
MEPIIGINMSYEVFAGHKPDDVPRFRDAYKTYISYADAIRESGGIALLLPPFKDLNYLDSYLSMVHGFVFTGGDDYPPSLYNEEKHPKTKVIHQRRVNADIYIAEKMLAGNKPILGICGGVQLIAIACGGRIIQHIKNVSMHNKKSKILDSAHGITVERESLLYSILGSTEIQVNSAHHQAVDPEQPGKHLRVTATAPDGTIESLELENPEGRFLLGVQWHPERMGDEQHRRSLFNSFIERARLFCT